MAMKLTSSKFWTSMFIAIVFLGSIFVVFTYGGVEGRSARLTVEFGQPGLFYDREMPTGEDTNALRLLSSFASKVTIDNGNVDCIEEYCKTESGEWKFYVIEIGPLGTTPVDPGVSPEKYILKDKDAILFRYEAIDTAEEINEQSMVNETINETLNQTE